MQTLNDLDPNSNEFIHWLFRGRCLVCYGFGGEINEIIPRSRGKEAMDWHNRVLMCREHHAEWHRAGASPDNIKSMQALRMKFLVAMGREEFI